MDSRQRVMTAVERRQPDRVPVDFWADAEVFDRLARELKLAGHEGVLAWAGSDLRYFNGPTLRQQIPPGPDGIVYDHWGVSRRVGTVTGTRRDGTSYRWAYKHMHQAPLAEAATVADIDRHAWPTPDIWDFSNVADACRTLRATGCAVVAGADRLDRAAQLKPAMYLRGTEQFMADLVLEPAIAEAILEHIAGYYLAYNRRLLEAGGGLFDIFFMGDDMGTQASTWVSPEMYRRFFKQPLAAYCELAHSFGVKAMYHTCGNVAPLVGDFVEAGVDILQSLQPAALGEQLAWLKREYGRDICFQGGIDIQQVLPRGMPDDVRRHVADRAATLAPGGGYIFGTAHNILHDTPTENVAALVEAYREYGSY